MSTRRIKVTPEQYSTLWQIGNRRKQGLITTEAFDQQVQDLIGPVTGMIELYVPEWDRQQKPYLFHFEDSYETWEQHVERLTKNDQSAN